MGGSRGKKKNLSLMARVPSTEKNRFVTQSEEGNSQTMGTPM